MTHDRPSFATLLWGASAIFETTFAEGASGDFNGLHLNTSYLQCSGFSLTITDDQTETAWSALGSLGTQSRLPKKRKGAKPRRDENVARAYGKLQLEANQELNKKNLEPKIHKARPADTLQLHKRKCSWTLLSKEASWFLTEPKYVGFYCGFFCRGLTAISTHLYSDVTAQPVLLAKAIMSQQLGASSPAWNRRALKVWMCPKGEKSLGRNLLRII